MEKIKAVLKNTDLYLVLFSALVIRAVGFDFNFAQALLAMSFLVYRGYNSWLETKREPKQIDDLKVKFEELKQEVTRNNVKSIASASAESKRYF